MKIRGSGSLPDHGRRIDPRAQKSGFDDKVPTQDVINQRYEEERKMVGLREIKEKQDAILQRRK